MKSTAVMTDRFRYKLTSGSQTQKSCNQMLLDMLYSHYTTTPVAVTSACAVLTFVTFKCVHRWVTCVCENVISNKI